MSKLRISDKLSLPIDAVTQKFGILGRTGSGKSYFATKLCEEMLDAKAQVVALDPVGVWWGLRLGTLNVGSDAGYNIPIFGGLHGDVPLEPTGGALIANLIVDKNISAVVDVSNFLMTEQRRFATDFATELFHRKKSQRSAIHVFFEEAQEFVPQQVRGDVAKMVGAFERLIKLGRNFGIGASLISQRPQSVNKDVLNQTECLVAFQMTGPQERETVRKWIAEKGVNEDIGSILPHLKVGDAHIWSPQWLKISKTITIAQKRTADVSSTPKPGVKLIEPKQLSQIELEDLSDKMLATIERAKQEDPKELRKQIVQLKRELGTKPLEKCNTQFKTVEKPVLKDGQLDKLVNYIGCIGKILHDGKAIVSKDFERTMARFEKIDILLKPIANALDKIIAGHPRSQIEFRSQPAVSRRPTTSTHQLRTLVHPKEQPRPAANGSNEGALGIGERRCAIAIAQHPNGVLREQLTTLTGYKRSTRNTYLQRMLAAGYVSQVGERFAITDAGIDWIGSDYQLLPTGGALRRYWIDKLPAGESAIFQVVLQNPNGISREEIGEKTSFKRSTRNTYLQRMAARELVIISGDLVRPSETLFE
jgi:uncharacterized protein